MRSLLAAAFALPIYFALLNDINTKTILAYVCGIILQLMASSDSNLKGN